MSHERRDISNHWRLDNLLSSMFRLTPKEHICWEGNLPLTGGTSQRARKTESISMARRQESAYFVISLSYPDDDDVVMNMRFNSDAY